MNTSQTPDYGEPWQRSCAEMYVINRHGEAHCICGKRLERVVSCVNACAGMTDPAAAMARLAQLERENAAMREELASLRAWKAEQLLVESQWDVQEIGKLLNLPLGADIRPSIQPAIESMREAIKEAHDALANVSTTFGRTPAQDAALAKLQPFLP